MTLGKHPADRSYEAEGEDRFEYSENWATRILDRGGSRSDRCLYHRQVHRQAIQGLAVPYIDVQTLGTADRDGPSGPFGGLGKLPDTHLKKRIEVDLEPRKFGMSDDDVRVMLEKLSKKRVLILKAGTGTGKSTFGPFRLMNPPDDAALRLTDLGPIIVTEPRVQATIGVATFVGEKLVAGCPWKLCSVHGRFIAKPMECAHPGPIESECSVTPDIEAPWQVCSEHGRFIPDPEIKPHPGEIGDDCMVAECSDHIGPGYPVGYQVKGDRKHDDSCQLVFVTDGTMLTWLAQGKLSKIGTVIIDEAHERSPNIDFILGYLKRELDRYPHLRVIVTSATFNVDYFVDFFGEENTDSWNVLPSKPFGYGAPLFPLQGEVLPCHCDPRAPAFHGPLTDIDDWLDQHWPDRFPEVDGVASADLHETTRLLHDLRCKEVIDPARWKDNMVGVLSRQVIALLNGLDDRRIHGDILAFLPTEVKINEAVADIRDAISEADADVYALLASTETSAKEAALATRPLGAKRRVIVSSNIAETSLTIEGIRFVVDSGLITLSKWDPISASGTIPTEPHSQAGIRQRWGRVGRDAPGWVFPLYTADQFAGLDKETAPGSTRTNQEQLIMTAKAGGIDNIQDFPWPAAHPYDEENMEDAARTAMKGFILERDRAESALALNGALDESGHLTAFGKDLQRFTTDGTAAFAMAVMFADQMACVPEVVTALKLLENATLAGSANGRNPALLRFGSEMPAAWRLLAYERHQPLYEGCRDDLDFVLRIAAAWEQADRDVPPWEPSDRRCSWADRWWVDDTALRQAAEARRATLELLSPAMKQEVKRFLDLRLVPRTRALMSRVLTSLQYVRQDDGTYRQAETTLDDVPAAVIHDAVRLPTRPQRVIALKRGRRGSSVTLQNIVEVVPWALEPTSAGETPDVFDLIARCATRCAPRVLDSSEIDPLLPYLESWPVGRRFRCSIAGSGDDARLNDVIEYIEAFAYSGLAESTEAAIDGEEDEGGCSQVVEDAALVDLPDDEHRWPGNPNPMEDEDLLALAPLDPADDELDRERGLETNDYSDTIGIVATAEAHDMLAAWEERAIGDEVHRPSVSLLPRQRNPFKAADDWYEVVGYLRRGDGTVAVQLAPAWLPSDIVDDGSTHQDLEFGRDREVAIGESFRIGFDTYRVFWRLDGRGRFVLSPGRTGKSRGEHDVPVSFGDGNADLLGDLLEGQMLSAHTVLGPSGTCTVSLLPLLSDHLSDMTTRRALSPRNDGRDPTEQPFFDAVVTLRPLAKDENPPADAPRGSYGQAELLERDSRVGIRHALGFRPDGPGSESVDTSEGHAIRVSLSFDRPVLEHRKHEAKLERLLTALQSPGCAFEWIRGADGQDTTRRRFVAWHPLKASVRDDLLALDDRLDWQLAVWTFWQRSHGRRIASVLPGENTDEREVPVKRHPSTDQYRQCEVGQIVRGTIETVDDRQVAVAVGAGIIGTSLREKVPDDVDLSLGKEVDGRVFQVDAERGRLTLDLATPYQVSGPAPPHWQHMFETQHPFSQQRALLKAACNASGVYSAPPNVVTVGWRTSTTAEVGLSKLKSIFAYPGCVISVPADGVGFIIGKQGAEARRLGSLAGIFSCTVQGDQSRVFAIGENATALSGLIASVQALLGVEMIVPNPRDNRTLIGTRGDSVNRLILESGCTGASGRDNGAWIIRGPNLEAVHRFVEAASLKVPGCRLGDSVSPVAVEDAVSGVPVAQWHRHAFAIPTVGIEWLTMSIPEPVVIDLLGGGPAAPRHSAVHSLATTGVGGAIVLTTDDDLRVIAVHARGGTVDVDIDNSSALSRPALYSYLAGLAAVGTGGSLDQGPDGVVRLRAGSAPATVRTGKVRDYSIDAVDARVREPLIMVALGDTIVVDAALATATEYELILAFFTGVATSLELNCRTRSARVLTIG